MHLGDGDAGGKKQEVSKGEKEAVFSLAACRLVLGSCFFLKALNRKTASLPRLPVMAANARWEVVGVNRGMGVALAWGAVLVSGREPR
jgi:hypothetical protein